MEKQTVDSKSVLHQKDHNKEEQGINFSEYNKLLLENFKLIVGMLDGKRDIETFEYDFEKYKRKSVSLVDDSIEEDNDEYIKFYWVEFSDDSARWKISLFYKDFDCGSGNIHVIPGAIQVWSDKENKNLKKIISMNFDEKSNTSDRRVFPEKEHNNIWYPQLDTAYYIILSSNLSEKNIIPELSEKFVFCEKNKFPHEKKLGLKEVRNGIRDDINKKLKIDCCGRQGSANSILKMMQWVALEEGKYTVSLDCIFYDENEGAFFSKWGTLQFTKSAPRRGKSPLGPNIFCERCNRWRLFYPGTLDECKDRISKGVKKNGEEYINKLKDFIGKL